jgi:hypothetical protein
VLFCKHDCSERIWVEAADEDDDTACDDDFLCFKQLQ